MSAVEREYLDAFWHLDTMRPMSMGLGQIPYDRIVWYFERCGMSGDQLHASAEIVREMDNGFLAWQAAEMERKAALKGDR